MKYYTPLRSLMLKIIVLALFLILLSLLSCNKHQNAPVCPKCPDCTTEVTPTPAPVVKEFAVKGWKAEWSSFIKKNIKDDSPLLTVNPDREYWVRLFAAMAKAESGFNLTSRYVESLGKDAVTGRANTSEGLLQMSYQDSRYHKCPFDWNVDKHLKYNDINKTIFNPFNNLKCGIIVLEKQIVKRKVLFTTDRPYYWAVLHKSRPGYKRLRKYLDNFLSL